MKRNDKNLGVCDQLQIYQTKLKWLQSLFAAVMIARSNKFTSTIIQSCF